MPYSDKNKQRKFDREWRRNYSRECRLKAINICGGKCVDCGNSDIRVLEFDHILPILRKKTGIKTGSSLISRILTNKEDLSNLVIRCSNCHTIKTKEEVRLYSTWKG